MSEPKYHYHLPPCAPWDIPATECWLEDMAAKGLHLAPDGFFWGVVTFEQGRPAKVRYRLEATTTQKGLFSNEYEPDSDMTELHSRMGWVYRARRDQFHIYVSAAPDAPELNTDPQVQAFSIAALSRYLRSSLLQTLMLFAIYTIFHFGDLFITSAVTLGTWRLGLLAALLGWDLLRRLRELFVLSRYKKQLQSGEPLPHRSGYGWRFPALDTARKALWIVLLCAILAFAGTWITEENYVSLENQSLPFATAADLYPGAEVKRMNGILESKVCRWTDPLAPENYDFSEYAEVTLNGETFDCYLTVQYHVTRFNWTARLLAREFVSQSGANPAEQSLSQLFGQEVITATELVLPDADYAAYFHPSREEPTLVLQRDNLVLRVNLDVLGGSSGFEPEELAQLVLSHLR